MPYQHAEDLAMQQRALELFERVSADSALADIAQWARKHHDVIARSSQ